MATVYLLCGFIGSGKTTCAKQLAQQHGAIRFSIDEWMIPLFGEHMPRELFDQRFNALTERFKTLAEQLLRQGVSVIFDYGFWSRRERDAFKQWAAQSGAECQLLYIEQCYDTCRERALARNVREQGAETSFQINDQMLELFWAKFEPPGPDEQARTL